MLCSVRVLFLPLLAMIVMLTDGSAIAQDAFTPAPRDDDWWVERHAAKLAEKDAMEQVDLVFIGDSITHSWEKAGAEIWKEKYEPRNALNLGYSGDRTEHVLWRLQGEENEIAGLTPKLFVVMIGTNNTGHRQDPSHVTAEAIGMIVDRLLEVSPESKVLLLGVFPRGEKRDDKLRMINSGINMLLRPWHDGQQVHFLDISSEFLDKQGVLPKEIMPDMLHPNEEGYALWAEAMEPKIAQLLGEE